MEYYSQSSDSIVNMYLTDPKIGAAISKGHLYDTMSRMDLLDRELKQMDHIWRHPDLSIRKIQPINRDQNDQNNIRADQTSSAKISANQRTANEGSASITQPKHQPANQKQVTFSSVPKRHYYTTESTSSGDQGSVGSSPRQDFNSSKSKSRSRSCHTQGEARKQMLFKTPIVSEISDKLDRLERQLDGFKYLQQRRNQYWVHAKPNDSHRHESISEAEMTTSTPIFRNNDEHSNSQRPKYHDSEQTLIQSKQGSSPRNPNTDRQRHRTQQNQYSNISVHDSSNQRPHLRPVIHSPNRNTNHYLEKHHQMTKTRFDIGRPSKHHYEEPKNSSPRAGLAEHPAHKQSSRESTSQPRNASNHPGNDDEFRHKLRLIRSRDSMREIQNLNGDIRTKIEELRYIMHSGKVQ